MKTTNKLTLTKYPLRWYGRFPARNQIACQSPGPKARVEEHAPSSQSGEKGCTRWMAILVFLSFAITLYVHSRHMTPLGLKMLLGLGNPWRWHIIVGWMGVAFVLGATVSSIPQIVHRWTIVGAGLLFVSWVVLMTRSDAPLFSLVTSVPFLVFLVVLGLHAVGSSKDLLAKDQAERRSEE
jgi:hypothetical protein